MIVVADSGPLHYLILAPTTVNCFGASTAGSSCQMPSPAETRRHNAGAPPIVRDWITRRPPSWVKRGSLSKP